MKSNDKKILETSLRQFEYHIAKVKQNKLGQLHGSFREAKASDAPSGAPDPDMLNGILDKHKNSPGSTPIIAVPKELTENFYSLLDNIQWLESYIAILVSYCIYNEHKEPYDTSDGLQASAFIRAQAKWKNYVLTGGVVKKLAGYLPLGDAVGYTMNKKVTNVSLHADLLSVLFGSFGFTAAVMKELDAILTNVASKLKSLNLKFEKIDQTLDHVISYYYFTEVPGTGEGTGIPALHQVHYRLFYLQISQKSWSVSVLKSSIKHFSFDANYFDSKATMSASLVANDIPLIKDSISTLTGKDADAIKKLVNVRAIRVDKLEQA